MKNANKMMMLLVSLAIFFQTASAQNTSLRCIVIDPGHGGMDSGAVSKDKKNLEKNFVLDISKRIGTKIKAAFGDSVKVYYTRTTDVFVPLQDRADFANKKEADLFISVHINANYRTTPSGHSVHILGASSNPNRDLVAGNLDVCKRENSVILLENDHTATYCGFDPSDEASYIFMTLMQSAYYEQSIYFASLVEKELAKGPVRVSRGVEQNPFYVLWKTAMPSVLLELGFITNDEDLGLLRQEDKRDALAGRICDAVKVYKINYDESMALAPSL